MTESATFDPLAGDFGDEAYREAVIDLLGVIAYGELSAFERMVDDAEMAPNLQAKMALAGMAATEFGHIQPLLDRISALGADPVEAMQRFEKPFDDFHAHTAPRDWLEGLIKAYVGDGLAADFYREVAAFLDKQTRDLIVGSLADEGHAAFAVEQVRAAIAADPRVGGRLALWGRRLMGEALSQAQRTAADRDSLTALLAGGIDRPGMDLASISRMFSRITERHAERMSALGLDA
ncbi:MAG TPA: ferritin-like fold-containing protein [Marmoricola sp.]|nr:ferritin-like fold-containing protein [Marmoricola sp.]